MRFAPIFAWTLATVAANPVPEADLEKRQTCDTRSNKAFSVLSGLGARGSSYCNDLLGLTTSFTSTVLPVRTPIVTVPSTTIILPRPLCSLLGLAKREDEEDLEKRQLLPGLGLLAAAQITAGCSCLGLKPRTVTSTITPPAAIPTTIISGIKTTCAPRVL